MSALTDLFSALATKIRSKTGGSDTYTPPEIVDAIDDVYDAGVAAGTTPTQTKTVTAGTSNVTVTPDAGYALSQVTVQPTPTETGSATPTTSAQTITPSSGKYLSSVGVEAIQIDSTNNSATPTTSSQTKNPTSGKYFSSFTVGAIPSEYIIPSGNKAITANGTGIDVKSYATASVSVSGTSITPSNSSPASMTSGTLYTPSANGYAISSYSSTTPSNASPVSLSSGSIHKMGGAGYAISSYSNVTPSDSSPVSLSSGSIYKMGGAGKAVASVTDITPSNTSPASVSSGGIYKASAAGYAISSYSSSSLTPSTSGQYFSSGWNRMTLSGYAYSSKPTPSFTETTLWTNSSPTISFAAQTVTLSSSISNYSYIKFIYRVNTSTSTTMEYIISKSDLQKSVYQGSTFHPVVTLGIMNSDNTFHGRQVYYSSTTAIQFGTATRMGSSYTQNGNIIPTYIKGLN